MNINNRNIKPWLFTILCAASRLLHADEPVEAANLSVEDLLNVEVTTVAKKTQALNNAAAAVFVISNEDIKRSGATNVPDALRLAPGLDVARINANQWAVSSRGFNSRVSNKLLVLVDGRSVYTRTFAGVYWENQDVMLEDVERIEVIRGPGAAMWGSNAVNGVINIITKHSSQTQGGLVTGGGGNQEGGFGSLRYGVKLGEDTTARAYVKGFERNENTLATGGKANDAWDKIQGGFRLDSQLNLNDTFTLQGDVYKTQVNQSWFVPQLSAPYLSWFDSRFEHVGGNVLGRFQHTFSPTSEYSLQFYYDGYKRVEGIYGESRHTLDLQFQHRFSMFDSHDIVWGLGYNFGHDNMIGNRLPNGAAPVFNANPHSVSDQVASGFLQDEMTLIDNKLWFTVGSRLEHNDYSGFEGQPFAKVMWAPHHQHRLWAGVSRAVRTPTRLEQHFQVVNAVVPPQANLPMPIQVTLQPNPSFGSERMIAYEAGYRTTLSKSVSLDVTGFYNSYNGLRDTFRGNPTFEGRNLAINTQFVSQMRGHTYGIEAAVVWQMLDWWRWDMNYSWLQTRLDDPLNLTNTAISPQQRTSIRAALSLTKDTDLDLWLRYVDKNYALYSLGNQYIDAYVTLDMRAAWRPYNGIELSVTGQNLLDSSHLEYISEFQTAPTLIDRSVYGKISWSF